MNQLRLSASTGCKGNRAESKKRLKSQKKKRKRCDDLEEEDEGEEPSVAENCSTDTRADHPKQLKTEQAGQKERIKIQNSENVLFFSPPLAQCILVFRSKFPEPGGGYCFSRSEKETEN